MQSMKAIVKLKPEPGIWMDTVAFPRIGHNDVLIKVLKTAICGTDIHIFNWDAWSRRTIPTPMAIGHEFVGVITEIGSEVRGLKEGDRVSAEGHITCGHCRNCRAGKRHLCRNTIGVGVNRPGCFAEYISVPASNVFRVPEMISDEIAAILDPFGNAAHTALSFDLVGEDVLITGAGPIGIMAVAIARHVGARFVVITDVNDYRLALAARMGATEAINVTRTAISDTMQKLGMQEGFDIGLEMSGNVQAFGEMLRVMNYGGRVAILGIPSGEVALDLTEIILKGLKLKGIYGREMFETWYKMTSMLQSQLDISPVITHRFAVDDYSQAFDVMRSGQSGKVILDWA
jgi:threonine 3-dehydrogenase